MKLCTYVQNQLYRRYEWLKVWSSIIFEIGDEFLFWDAFVSVFIQLFDDFVDLNNVSSLQYFSNFLPIQIPCLVIVVVIKSVSQELTDEQIFPPLHHHYELVEIDFAWFVFVNGFDHLGDFLWSVVAIYILVV